MPNWKRLTKRRKQWIETAGIPTRLGAVLDWLHTDRDRHEKEIRDLKNRVATLEAVRVHFSGDPEMAKVMIEHTTKPGRRPRPPIAKATLDGKPWYPPVGQGEWVCKARDLLKEIVEEADRNAFYTQFDHGSLRTRTEQLLDQLPQGG
jgi:sugar phosphate isomerase/epimerase